MFCTACPDAPLTRLSMTLNTFTRPAAVSSLTVMRQKFVRATSARLGTASTTSTNGSPS